MTETESPSSSRIAGSIIVVVSPITASLSGSLPLASDRKYGAVLMRALIVVAVEVSDTVTWKVYTNSRLLYGREYLRLIR